MAIDYSKLAQPKGRTRKSLKAAKDRVEMKVIKRVRAKCVVRDGFCRLMGMGPCQGVSEWAHMHAKRRSQTRGKAPELRHTTSESFMACTSHHAWYDAHKITVEPLTDRGADGPMSARVRGEEYSYAC